MNDTELISVIRKSRNEGYRQLVNEYGGYAYTIVKNRLRTVVPEHDIEECVSDIFVEIIMNFDKYNFEDGSLKGFISTVSSRKAVDLFRKISSGISSLDSEDAPEIAAEDDTEKYSEEKEMSRELWRKVSELGEPDSEIIVLQYFYGKSVPEIAAKLKMSVAAVYKRSLRARGKLKKILKDRKECVYEYETGKIS